VKQFHFRLERLLEIRAFRERGWLAKLAEASGHCARVARQLRANTEARQGAFGIDARRGYRQPGGYGQPGGYPLDLDLLTYRERYIARLGAEKHRLNEELENRKRQRDEVQKKYLEVSKDRKILDKLKERKAAEYYAHGRREEFKAQDDLSCDRFIRSRDGSG
jgi:flagellar FliJ protein